jgi:hypothetical protein
MRTRTFVRLAFTGVVLAFLLAGTALAQPMDKRTFFTFSGPVAIPGVTLPAGKYMFRVADTSSRDVLQVLSADGKKSYASFFAIRAQRAESVPTPEVRFMETAAGMPAAIDTWWYPSERTGYEFIYPKEQARLLARGTGQPILTTRGETVTPEAELTVVAPTGEERAWRAPTPYTLSLPAVIGEVAPEAIPVAEPSQQARAALPRTASARPVVGLLGVALLLGAALMGVRRVRA